MPPSTDVPSANLPSSVDPQETDRAPGTANVPFWTLVADVAAACCLVLAIAVVVYGRLRLPIGPVRLTMSAPERLLIPALVLLVVRHWRHPRPAIHERALAAWRRLWSEPGIRGLAASYWTIRLSILLAGYLATAAYGLPQNGPFRVSSNEFLNLPARWDSGWYLAIASDGYRYTGETGQQSIAFFPAFPMAMRVGGMLLGVDQTRMRTELDGTDRARLLWSGVIVSLILGWCATIFLFRLAQRWTDPGRAAAGVILLQAYPFSVFYGAAYSESMFLAGAAGAWLMFERRAWSASAAWGLLAGLARPNGFIVSVPLGLLLLARLLSARREPRESEAGWREYAGPVLAAAAPTIALLLFSAVVYSMTGDPFRWAQLHAAWGREYRSVLTLATEYYDYISREGVYVYTSTAPTDALNLAAAIFALAAIVPVWRRLGLASAALLLATILPPLSMGGVLSMGRITSTAFPIFVWLGSAMSPGTTRRVVMAFLVLQGLAAALFFTWRPLY